MGGRAEVLGRWLECRLCGHGMREGMFRRFLGDPCAACVRGALIAVSEPVIVRTTPRARHCRDPLVFPCADRQRKQIGTPTYYYATVHRRRVSLVIDGFFLPPDYEQQLRDLYEAYLGWWRASNARRRVAGIAYSLPMRDYLWITVLREHAEWWIGLLDELCLYVYNPWHCDRESDRLMHDRDALEELWQAGDRST